MNGWKFVASLTENNQGSFTTSANKMNLKTKKKNIATIHSKIKRGCNFKSSCTNFITPNSRNPNESQITGR